MGTVSFIADRRKFGSADKIRKRERERGKGRKRKEKRKKEEKRRKEKKEQRTLIHHFLDIFNQNRGIKICRQGARRVHTHICMKPRSGPYVTSLYTWDDMTRAQLKCEKLVCVFVCGACVLLCMCLYASVVMVFEACLHV